MNELPAGLCDRLTSAGLDPADVVRVVRTAFAEDLPTGADVTTSATIPAGTTGTAHLVARGAGVVAGLPVAEVVFVLAAGCDDAAGSVRQAAAFGSAGRPAPSLACGQLAADGDLVRPEQALMTIHGALEPMLIAERTALNLLTHLSGVASLTRRWVDAVAGTGARIRDTRKTLPGLRALQKYAVRCGGGLNHRMSLSDAALIKDNHVAAAGSVTAALTAVTERLGADPDAAAVPVEVECDTLEQVEAAVAAGAQLILLDNFTVGQLEQAVGIARGRALLEASGGLTLTSAAQVAATGVDFLAVGALTHSAPALDIGLDLIRAG
jgi:nicotinate-nucleotide pyrophosphorylase